MDDETLVQVDSFAAPNSPRKIQELVDSPDFAVSINRLYPGEKLALGASRWGRFNWEF